MFGRFKKQPEPQAEAEPDKASDEDMRNAMFIQQKAQIGSLFAKRLDDPTEDFDAHLRHYQSVRTELLKLLDLIEDEFCRSFAAHMLIKMCMDAREEPVARALLAGIRDRSIRGYVFKDFPEFQNRTADGDDDG